MKYKLACIDIDGTLLNNDFKISEVTKNSIKKAYDNGVHIVISTGRTYVGAKFYSDLLEVKSPIIACNGAIIGEKDGNDVIYKSVIDEILCIELFGILKKYGIKPTFITPLKRYTNSFKNRLFVEYLKFKGIKSVDKLDFISTWNKLFEIIKIENDNIIKCEVYNKDLNKLATLREELEKINGIEITSSFKNNIEITKKGTSKGSSMKILAEYYNIKKEEIIAIGDSENDLLAIEFAGMGIAMGNASEEVKKRSNYITDDNNNDGVAKAIDKFILCMTNFNVL